MLIREIRFRAIGEVEVATLDERLTPDDGEAAVAPSWLGICGSDMHVLLGRHPFVKPPVVTGHEANGTVTELGAGAGKLTIGQQVLINPLVHCGQCVQCRRGLVNSCEQAKVLGFKLGGAARTGLVLPESQLHPVPAGVPQDLACLAEPLAAGVHAVRRVEGPMGLDEVLVIGGGPIGLSVLLAARAAGAGSVTLVEPIESKRRLAERLGADRVVAPDELPQQRRFTAALDCVDKPATLRSASDAVVGGGRVVLVGVPDSEQALALDWARLQRFEIDLVGSGLYTSVDVDMALRLIAQGQIEPSTLVSARFALAEAPSAFAAAMDANTVKVLVRLDS